MLLQGAREASIPVIYIMYTIHPGLPTVTPAWVYNGIRLFSGTLLSPARPGISSLEGLFEGTWGWEVIEELAPEEGDILVQKHHLGGFWDTNLDKILRGNGIETVVVTGTATSGCVFDTAVGAAANDYYTVYVRDCVTTMNPKTHEVGMRAAGKPLRRPVLGGAARPLGGCRRERGGLGSIRRDASRD